MPYFISYITTLSHHWIIFYPSEDEMEHKHPVFRFVISSIIIADSCFIINLNAKSFYTCLPPNKSGSAETIVTFLTYYHSPMDLDCFIKHYNILKNVCFLITLQIYNFIFICASFFNFFCDISKDITVTLFSQEA